MYLGGYARNDKRVDQDIQKGDSDEQGDDYSDRYERFQPVHTRETHCLLLFVRLIIIKKKMSNHNQKKKYQSLRISLYGAINFY